jgi:hypothetical protein
VGEKVTKKSIGYEKYQKFSSAQGLSVAILLSLLLCINFSYAIHKVVTFGKAEYAHDMLIYVPIVVVGFLTAMIFVMRNSLKR